MEPVPSSHVIAVYCSLYNIDTTGWCLRAFERIASTTAENCKLFTLRILNDLFSLISLFICIMITLKLSLHCDKGHGNFQCLF